MFVPTLSTRSGQAALTSHLVKSKILIVICSHPPPPKFSPISRSPILPIYTPAHTHARNIRASHPTILPLDVEAGLGVGGLCGLGIRGRRGGEDVLGERKAAEGVGSGVVPGDGRGAIAVVGLGSERGDEALSAGGVFFSDGGALLAKRWPGAETSRILRRRYAKPARGSWGWGLHTTKSLQPFSPSIYEEGTPLSTMPCHAVGPRLNAPAPHRLHADSTRAGLGLPDPPEKANPPSDHAALAPSGSPSPMHKSSLLPAPSTALPWPRAPCSRS